MPRDIGNHHHQPILVEPQDIEVVASNGGTGLEQGSEFDAIGGRYVCRKQALLQLARDLELLFQHFLLGYCQD